jgi:hypothetical protein
LNKYIKYTLRTLGVFFAVLFLAFLAVSLYVSSHKEKLIADATNKISEKIRGKIAIGDMGVNMFKNFPYIAITIKNLKVTDSLYAKHGHALIEAEKIFVRINPLNLLLLKVAVNKLTIQNAAFYVYTDTSGYSNNYMLKGDGKTKKEKKKGDDDLKDLLDKIELENIAITIDDAKENKLFDFLINRIEIKTKIKDSTFSVHVKQDILIKSFSFNKSQGSFAQNHTLVGEYDLKYFPKIATLQIDSMPVTISKQPFLFKAKFEFGTIQKFDLDIKTPDIQLDFAKTLLTKKIAHSITRIVNVTGPLKVHTSIAGSLVGKGDPYINARFESVNSTITTSFIKLDSATFKGSFLNENVAGSLRNDENSKVSVHQFDAKFGGLRIKSDDILIINLTNPYLSADIHSDFDVNDPDKSLDTQSFIMSKGSGKIDIMFEGPLDNPTPQNTKKSGVIELHKGFITMTASDATLSDCNARIRIDNSNINLDTLQCIIGGSKITMQGRAKNVLSLIGENPEGVELDLNVFSPQLNIDHLSSIVSRKYPVKKRDRKNTNTTLAKNLDRIDALLTNGRINVSVKADKLKFHSFEANNLLAKMRVDENSWDLQQASLIHGAGKLLVKAKVRETSGASYNLSGNVNMQNLDAQRIMREFDDFGMRAFTSKNIRGTLTLNSDLALNLTSNGAFDMGSLMGKATFSINKGELLDFGPIKNIQNFLTKNRDMSNIKFAEIKDDLDFKKGEITINRMEINSSVLMLFVEGVYGPKNTDISIQVPVKNLTTKKDYTPENVGAGKSGGMSVFLRAKSDETGKVNIKYDPFKRFRKSPVEKKK